MSSNRGGILESTRNHRISYNSTFRDNLLSGDSPKIIPKFIELTKYHTEMLPRNVKEIADSKIKSGQTLGTYFLNALKKQ